ncbi:MAG: TonB-dependent receptor, partial [Planctomycetes bacterium]|nr:TonB-dependent receptor [Planctomycetota bacterium]
MNGAIAAIQGNAVDAWLSGLDGIELPQDAVEYPEIGTDPRTQIQIRFSAPNLRPREYTAKWIPASLTFERQEWKLSALPFALALAVINALNDEDQRPDWIRQIPSIGVFREGDQSTANELHVVTAAPWADDADDLPEQLALRIPLDSTDTDIPMPRSWPLVVRYLDLIDHPMIVGPADPAIPSSTLWTGLPAELTPLVDAGLATIQLDATFQGKVRLTDGDSPQLETELVLSWQPSSSYADMSVDAVTAGLDALIGGQALSYGFSLGVDEQGQALPQWVANHTVEDVAAVLQAIPVYDRLLERFSERSAVEATLDTFFSQGTPAASGTGVKMSETEAFQHLEAIWTVKSIPKLPANIGDFPTLSRMIQAKKLFIRNRVQGPDYAVPTVFVEYFFGPRDAFAIVWGMAADGATMEEPSLIRLGAVNDVLDGQQTAALMFESVLAAVPLAVAAKRFTQFAGVLGLVLAMDDAPKTLSVADVVADDFSFRSFAVRPVGKARWEMGVDINGRYGLEALDSFTAFDRDGDVLFGREELAIENARRTDVGLYTSTEALVGSRWSLGAGVRVDNVTTHNEGGFFGDQSTENTALSGYGSLKVELGRGVSLTGQVAHGFRDPTLSDRYFRGITGRGIAIGNPNLEPERANQFDVALRVVSARVRWAVYGYFYRFSDLIERFEVRDAVFLFRTR